MAWILVVSALAAPAGAQRAGRAVDCATLDPQKLEALPDEQVIICGGSARTAGELRRWLEERRQPAASDEEAAAAAARLEALQRQVAVDTDALRARMEAVLEQARAGATFVQSRDGRQIEELRPQALDLERQMKSARTTAAKDRIQGEARELLGRLATARPIRVPLVPRP
jgi:hypothetical protein